MQDQLLKVPMYDVRFSGLSDSFCVAAGTISEALSIAQEAAKQIERSVTAIRESGLTLITPKTVTYEYES